MNNANITNRTQRECTQYIRHKHTIINPTKYIEHFSNKPPTQARGKYKSSLEGGNERLLFKAHLLFNYKGAKQSRQKSRKNLISLV